MTSRSKEKMAAAFRKLFRGNRKIASPDVAGASGSNNEKGTESPARRLKRHTVQPVDAAAKTVTERRVAGRSRSESSEYQFKVREFQVRSRRLMKELKDVQRAETSLNGQQLFTVELVNDNLFEWNVKLLRIDSESDLAADMRELGFPWITLHINFPDNYPFSPPFMRVVSPPIEKGFVMEGGAICMELLTPRGWASAYTIEAVIMQFAASLVKGQGRIVRKTKSGKEFSRRTAEESFRSLVKTHDKYGWVTPPLAEG